MGRPLSELRLRRSAATAPGRQLERRLALLVREGRLPPGQRLPSTRWLAARLGVHRNTVAAAHRRLADRGLLEVRHGARSRVPAYRAEPAASAGGPEFREGGPHAASAGEAPSPAGEAPPGPGPSVLAASHDPATARLMAAELRAALRSAGARADVRGWGGPESAPPPAGGGGRRKGGPGEGSGRPRSQGPRLAVALPGPAAARLAAAGRPTMVRARLAPRRDLRRRLRRAPPLAVAVLRTASRVLREAVLADADELRPGEVTVRPGEARSPAAGRDPGVGADLVIADALAPDALWERPPAPDRPRRVPLPLLSRETVAEVVRALAGSARGARRSAGGRP